MFFGGGGGGEGWAVRGVLSARWALFGPDVGGTGKTFEKKRTENDAKKCGRTGLSVWGLEISLFVIGNHFPTGRDF